MAGDDQIVKLLVSSNPKKPGSKAFARFEKYLSGATIEENLRRGLIRADIDHDSDLGRRFIELLQPPTPGTPVMTAPDVASRGDMPPLSIADAELSTVPRRRWSGKEHFNSVFDHHVDAVRLQKIREQIVALANLCLHESGYDIDDKAEELGDKLRSFNEILYYGRLNPSFRIADELIWKWSEATGKYVGCPYWSAKARKLFDKELAEQPHTDRRLRMKDAWRVEKILQCSQRDPTQSIAHEHVYPRKLLKDDLKSPSKTNTAFDLKRLFSRLAVGCVVLRSEHNDLARDGDRCGRRPARPGRPGRSVIAGDDIAAADPTAPWSRSG